MAGQNTLTFTDANFDREVLEAKGPVVVDFWAEWCGPCRMLSPVIDELATEYAGKVKIGKCDTDANQSTAVRYGIQSIPTVLVFNGGREIKKFVGLTPKKAFKDVLDSLVG